VVTASFPRHARENGHPGLDSRIPTAPLLRSLAFGGAWRGNDTLCYFFTEELIIYQPDGNQLNA